MNKINLSENKISNTVDARGSACPGPLLEAVAADVGIHPAYRRIATCGLNNVRLMSNQQRVCSPVQMAAHEQP